MDTGTLYYGDCLDWMSKWNDNVVDLIYLDPPFNSAAGYNILFGQDQRGGGTVSGVRRYLVLGCGGSQTVR